MISLVGKDFEMILGVTGLARAGKDVFADYLVKNYGFTKINTSDVLRDELIAKGKEPTKDNMSILADEWRAEHGCFDIVLKRSLDAAQNLDKAVIIGFRSLEEVELMRKLFPGCMIIAIVASDEARFSRRTSEDPQDFEGFIGRDRRDIENKGMDKAIAAADYVIDNDSGGWGIREKAAEFMRAIGSL